VAGGANFNFYRGSTQQLNASFTSPKTFHDGFGAGLFIAPLLEYRLLIQDGVLCYKLVTIAVGDFDQVITVTVLLIYQLT
jgi:hypothetical protein